jgi:FeS assembly SUF system protein
MRFSRLFKGKRTNAAAPPAVPQPPEPDRPARESSPGDTEQAVIEVLRTVHDPEIPVDIYEMGLVYNIDVDPSGKVVVCMTLTSPGCPVAGSMIPEIERKIAALPSVTGVHINLVWDPPWDQDRMSDAAKLQLGLL